MASRRKKSGSYHLRGEVASEGLASGPVFALGNSAQMPTAEASTPIRERRKLKNALATAREEIEQLIEQAAGQGSANVLAIQLGMLGDKSLAQPALARIANGALAWTAWNQTVATDEIDAPAGEYASARDSDTRDLRARVSRILAGEGTETVPYGAIVIAEDIAPSSYLEIDWSLSGGIGP